MGVPCDQISGDCSCKRYVTGRYCNQCLAGYFCAPLDFSKYEAEDATGHAPDDPSLPGKARPQAEVDCVEHLNNQLQRHRRHRRIATAQQQRAALRRIRQLQQT
ncbi:hypothetical protein CRUP_035233, partial [Coryphaenoides rupestris]